MLWQCRFRVTLVNRAQGTGGRTAPMAQYPNHLPAEINMVSWQWHGGITMAQYIDLVQPTVAKEKFPLP